MVKREKQINRLASIYNILYVQIHGELLDLSGRTDYFFIIANKIT